MHWVPLRSKPLSYHRHKMRVGYQSVENERGGKVALSPEQRVLIGSISRTANLGPFLRRWLLARIAMLRAPRSAKMRNGYALISGVPGYERIVALGEQQMAIYQQYLAEGPVALTRRKIDPVAYEREIAKTADDPLKHIPIQYSRKVTQALVDFAMQPTLVATAARYLGVIPVLAGVRLLYSPNVDGALGKAQLFHLDPEGARQAKGFMAIRPVGPENSPFTFVPARQTRALFESGEGIYNRKRVEDKYIEMRAPRSVWVAHTGAPGDALMVDTSRCFHFGSRPNEQPRFLFYFSYLDPFSSHFPIIAPLQKYADRWRGFKTDAPFADYLLSRRL